MLSLEERGEFDRGYMVSFWAYKFPECEHLGRCEGQWGDKKVWIHGTSMRAKPRGKTIPNFIKIQICL